MVSGRNWVIDRINGAHAHDKWAVRIKLKGGAILCKGGEDEQADQDCDRMLYPSPTGGFSSNPTDI